MRWLPIGLLACGTASSDLADGRSDSDQVALDPVQVGMYPIPFAGTRFLSDIVGAIPISLFVPPKSLQAHGQVLGRIVVFHDVG